MVADQPVFKHQILEWNVLSLIDELLDTNPNDTLTANVVWLLGNIFTGTTEFLLFTGKLHSSVETIINRIANMLDHPDTAV